METRPRVLLADDHPGMVKTLERILSIECDVLGVVADGSEVAAAAARLHPVVTIVDVNLPHVNGLDACRSILQINPHAKVIVLTALFDDAIRAEALSAGASGFFSKLTATTDLIDAIRSAWAECPQLPAQ
jgi:DNA-binding NarL/FixJ family response regulator